MKRTIVGFTLTVAMAATAVFAEAPCLTAEELAADQTRFVETQLKIASLQCPGGETLDLSDLYMTFILEKRPYLVRAEGPLAEYLGRTQGKVSVQAYLADRADKVSFKSAEVGQFCTKALVAAEAATKLDDPRRLLPLMAVPYERPANMCAAD